MNNRHLRFGFPPRRTPPDPLCPASFGGLEDRPTPNSFVTHTGHETSKDEPAMPIRACEWCSAPDLPGHDRTAPTLLRLNLPPGRPPRRPTHHQLPPRLATPRPRRRMATTRQTPLTPPTRPQLNYLTANRG